jgi:ketosteroid isomerase-like protein
VNGIWLEGDEAAARGGFDPAFVMQVAQETGTISVSLDAWLERLGLAGEALDENITHEIEVLDQVGAAAVARVRVYRAGEPLYTDYMSLYKTADGWKIVAKTFHAHS